MEELDDNIIITEDPRYLGYLVILRNVCKDELNEIKKFHK